MRLLKIIAGHLIWFFVISVILFIIAGNEYPFWHSMAVIAIIYIIYGLIVLANYLIDTK